MLTLPTVLALVFIAIAYTTWGMLGKYFGVNAGWMCTIIFIGTLIGGMTPSLPTIMNTPMPSAGAVTVMLAAGIVNGIAVYVASMKMVDPSIPSAVFFVMLLVVMVVITPFFGLVLHKQNLTTQQWLGIPIAGLAIFLLSR